MSVSAVIKILQYDTDDGEGSVRDIAPPLSRDGSVRDITAGTSAETIQRHLPAVTNPFPGRDPAGWATQDKERWSDSPTFQPYLLYRHRFSWGRDKEELFPQPGLGTLGLGDEGSRWGNLDNYHGVLIYEEVAAISSDYYIRQVTVEDSVAIRNSVSSISDSFNHMRTLGIVESEIDISQFPFLLVALPEPWSIKNPVDTDIYIRLANYTFPLASGTISLYINDVLQSDLEITEFFGGLGGYDVTWNNNFLFGYDEEVRVRWIFFDQDVPANRFDISYPFYTVPDLAGPRVTNLVPADEATGVPLLGPIRFDVKDLENDVNLESLRLYVNNVLVEDGVTGTLETTRFENKKGYTVTYTPFEPWLYGDLIPVAVFVSDTSVNENETFFTYSFTTLESTAPRLINLAPSACTVGVPTGTHVSADVIDGGHGIDKDSIVFTVEEIERGGSIVLIPIVHRDD